MFRHALARLRALVRRDVIAGEIREELQTHVAMRAEDFERQGMSRREARRQAVRRFGNLAVIQDRGYDVRGGGIMETIIQDLRYSLRLFAAQRAFSIVAVLTLAIGVGLSTALFSVIHAAVIRPLPCRRRSRRVRPHRRHGGSGTPDRPSRVGGILRRVRRPTPARPRVHG